ncbi:glycosyltransferase family 61 protein [Leptolyngbya ohadii]|uniref:glycosyltransferase family 61 protein n=1 Tax=Leptolyngbya ohadii TaxID=1962290 RepID=UPI000B59C8F4|nr:glycosyltransferase family 61 protein [Leptolyngbya ohadii]
MNPASTAQAESGSASPYLVQVPSRTAPAGKVFTYPTRLVEAWSPQIMQFDLPTDRKEEEEVALEVKQGSTDLLRFNQPQSLKERVRKALAQSIDLGDQYIYDSRYDTSGNIAHLLAAIVPGVLVCQQYFPDLKVVLRAKAKPVERNIYRILGVSTVETNGAVRGQIITFRASTTSDRMEPFSYELPFSNLFKALSFEGYTEHTPERVFISRKGSRTLINEAEVEAFLQRYGFQKVYFEDIPIEEQWSIARNAKAVVGIHGAALSNLVFNCNSLKLVELFHPGYVVNMYRNITHGVGGKWAGVTGQITPDVIKRLDYQQQPRAFALTSTKIDLNSLQMALDYLDIEKI